CHLVQVPKYLATLIAHFGGGVLDSKTKVTLSYSREGFLDLYGPVLDVLCGQAVVTLNRRPFDRGLVRITHDFAARLAWYLSPVSQSNSIRMGPVGTG